MYVTLNTSSIPLSIFFLEIQMKFCDTKSNISLKIWIKRNSMLFDVLSKFTYKIDFEEAYKPKHLRTKSFSNVQNIYVIRSTEQITMH